ncbi:hypothetical protein ACRAWG_09855 [Methylobacterium sp. P31]
MISTSAIRAALIEAAESGLPPVAAISAALIERVGSDDAQLAPVKQFVGLCVKAVLEDAGFEVAGSGVRLPRDPVFVTGAVYRRATQFAPSLSTDLLIRILGALSDDEAAAAADILKARLASRGQ